MNQMDIYPLCISCELSKNFPANKLPKSFTYKHYSNKSDNHILLKIYESRAKIIPTESFTILVDESRYCIETVSKTTNEIILKQYVLHYDSKREKLIRVYGRYVRITI